MRVSVRVLMIFAMTFGTTFLRWHSVFGLISVLLSPYSHGALHGSAVTRRDPQISLHHEQVAWWEGLCLRK